MIHAENASLGKSELASNQSSSNPFYPSHVVVQPFVVARLALSLYARNFHDENLDGAARVLNVSWVYIPKWPFPPPRAAQSKSGSSSESWIIPVPSAI
jgi:hypothetical protein